MDKKPALVAEVPDTLVAGKTVHQVHRTHLSDILLRVDTHVLALTEFSLQITYTEPSQAHTKTLPQLHRTYAYIHNRPPLSPENLKAQHTDSQIRPDS